MAAGSLPQVSSSTRIAFFTYGFFRAVSKTDATLSRWGAVILDEAHERNIDAELLLPMMAWRRARCQVRARGRGRVVRDSWARCVPWPLVGQWEFLACWGVGPPLPPTNGPRPWGLYPR